MSTRHLALNVALIAALGLAAQRAEAAITRSADEIVTALTSDRDGGDGRPPTTGPTNPTGY